MKFNILTLLGLSLLALHAMPTKQAQAGEYSLVIDRGNVPLPGRWISAGFRFHWN